MADLPRLRLVHWKATEAAPLLEALKGGYRVDYEERPDYRIATALRAEQPAAVVIDLSRLPSHGRELAIFLRGSKTTRHLPIVFVGGDPEKVAAIQAQLPDAVYTTGSRVLAAVRRAIREAPAAPVVPPQMMERFAGRSAAQKLGIRDGATVALYDPPRDYTKVLGELPSEVTLAEAPKKPGDVTLWFVRDTADYQSALPGMRHMAAKSKFWILWPKQSGKKQAAINSNTVRESAIAVGLVDYKVCSVNDTWSALAFATKK